MTNKEMTHKDYTYIICNWDPINTNAKNLLSKTTITPDIKLLELFKIAPLHNILCSIHNTKDEHYDEKLTYGTIEKSTIDETYYIILDLIWLRYPKETGQIKFYS